MPERAGRSDPVRAVAVGLVCGLLALVMAIGNGNLLFRGLLAGHVGAAIGLSILATGALTAAGLVVGTMRGVISVSQSTPIVALSLPLNAVIDAMAGAPDRTRLATAVAAVTLTTLLTGAAFLLLGLFRLGRFIRFVPFPVVGGFLAGTGWLIVLGGASVVLGAAPGPEALAGLADPAGAGKAAVAAAVVLLFALAARARSTLVVPVVIFTALAAFNIIVLSAGIPHQALAASGWLASLSGSRLWPPLVPSDVAAIDWAAVARILLQAPVIVTVAVLAFLMNMSGLELTERRDIDLDSELRATGAGNLAAGLGAALPGYPSLSLAGLAGRLGRAGPLVGATVAAVCFAALAAGDAVARLVPTPVFGGLLIWIGGALLAEWLVQPIRRVSLWEYLTILLIFAVIALFGFTWGVGVGLVAAAVLFAVEYGRVDVVRHILTGREYQSSLDQSDERRAALEELGDAILIVRLHGFLFFGTADRLRRNLQRLVAGRPVRYLLLDFRRVSGLDSSAVLSFVRLGQLAERDGFVVYLSGLGEELQASLARGGLPLGEGRPVRIAADLDHVLEDCENELLAAFAPAVLRAEQRGLAEHLARLLPQADLVGPVLASFERLDVAPGADLIVQGSASNDLFLVESGRAAVMLAIEGDRRVRLASIAPGSVIGEISFYTGKPRTASVVAETPLVAWRLTREALAALERTAPAVVAHLHRSMATTLAERLTATNRLVRFLAD